MAERCEWHICLMEGEVLRKSVHFFLSSGMHVFSDPWSSSMGKMSLFEPIGSTKRVSTNFVVFSVVSIEN